MDNEWGPGDSALLAGRYRMGARLGAGGMAEVFRAEDARLGRDVAVKVLRPELATDPVFRDRFEGEARAAARLSHRNVVAVYDVGEGPHGRPFIVMELVAGGGLAERLRSGPLSEAEAVHVGLEVLAALEAAHAAGIVHRDIKPGNILFSPDGSAKVADFGIAKALVPDAGTSDLTATSKVIGTPRYLPPERVEGRPATVESDLWGVGVVLHEALAGAYPFPGDTPLAAVVAAQRGQSTPLVVSRPDVSPAVAAVVDRALAPDPADRYPSAAEMARELRSAGAAVGPETAVLDPVLAGAGAEAAATTTPMSWAPSDGGPPAPHGWHRPGLPWWRQPAAAAVAAVSLAVLLLVLLWPGGGSPTRPARSTTTTTRLATPVTAPSTTTTVTCAALQAQRQALADQQKQLGKPPHGKAPQPDTARQALDTQIQAVDQQIQQLCGPGGGPPGPGDQGGGG
ncbi:MAG TPA: protein kinase [Acidimicrobiales bacterium]|nr:protein kinase [Acidimicrobiales bacterium]